MALVQLALFLWLLACLPFQDVPVASGSIAQIHRARLSATGSHLTGGKVKPGTVVAVKVSRRLVTAAVVLSIQHQLVPARCSC
jgi:hypothetical protein